MHLLSDLYITAFIFEEKVSIKTFNISLESTQNKQQFDTKISYTQERRKKVMVLTKLITFYGFSSPSPIIISKLCEDI